MFQARKVLLCGLVVAVIVGTFWFRPATRVASTTLPHEITDDAFWKMIDDFSEAGGYFRSDNFVSNERQFQWVLSDLKRGRPPGGVYLGVGPEQNFTYLAALQPRIAFIIDIRRQNMLLHLIYKAIFELSRDRAGFLSLLFSKPRRDDLDENDPIDKLLQAYSEVPSDKLLYEANLTAILNILTVRHHFRLSEQDVKSIRYIYSAFFEAGPSLAYSFNVGQGAAGSYGFGNNRWFSPRGMPSYAQLMEETDGEGHHRSFLASADNFRTIQDLERRNIVIPLVGDFAGPKTLHSVAAYLKEHDATVTAFYTSNVEQYLFQQDDDWSRFYKNVESLPLAPNSTFIRSVAMGRRFQSADSRASLLCPILDLLTEFHSGSLDSYSAVIQMSH